MDAEAINLLRAIRDEIRALRADLAGRGAKPQGRHADLAEHLQAVAAVVERRIFSVNELVVHSSIPEGAALRAAIIGMAGSLNGKRLGKFLRRIEGENIGGLRIERVGEDRLGAAWAVRVCESETRKPAYGLA